MKQFFLDYVVVVFIGAVVTILSIVFSSSFVWDSMGAEVPGAFNLFYFYIPAAVVPIFMIFQWKKNHRFSWGALAAGLTVPILLFWYIFSASKLL